MEEEDKQTERTAEGKRRPLRRLSGGKRRDWTKKFPGMGAFVRIAVNEKLPIGDRLRAIRRLIGTKAEPGALMYPIQRNRWNGYRSRLIAAMEEAFRSGERANPSLSREAFDVEWKFSALIEAERRARTDGGLDALGAHLTNVCCEVFLGEHPDRPRTPGGQLIEFNLPDTDRMVEHNRNSSFAESHEEMEAEGDLIRCGSDPGPRSATLHAPINIALYKLDRIEFRKLVNLLAERAGLKDPWPSVLAEDVSVRREPFEYRDAIREDLRESVGVGSKAAYRKRINRYLSKLMTVASDAIASGEIKVGRNANGRWKAELVDRRTR